MAFKKAAEYTAEKYQGRFILQNDKDCADVIFLYRSIDDVLFCDAHYIKSYGYTGYIQCNGPGCAACSKGLRIQSKLFIPLYNITAGEIQFWDRSERFFSVLQSDVFRNYPDPSQFVFKITRNGVAGSVDTTYAIQAIGSNKTHPELAYEAICAANKITFPEFYETVCKEMSNSDMLSAIAASNSNNSSDSSSGMPEYSGPAPTPRASATPTGAASVVPEAAPEMDTGLTAPEVTEAFDDLGEDGDDVNF